MYLIGGLILIGMLSVMVICIYFCYVTVPSYSIIRKSATQQKELNQCKVFWTQNVSYRGDFKLGFNIYNYMIIITSLWTEIICMYNVDQIHHGPKEYLQNGSFCNGNVILIYYHNVIPYLLATFHKLFVWEFVRNWFQSCCSVTQKTCTVANGTTVAWRERNKEYNVLLIVRCIGSRIVMDQIMIDGYIHWDTCSKVWIGISQDSDHLFQGSNLYLVCECMLVSYIFYFMPIAINIILIIQWLCFYLLIWIQTIHHSLQITTYPT